MEKNPEKIHEKGPSLKLPTGKEIGIRQILRSRTLKTPKETPIEIPSEIQIDPTELIPNPEERPEDIHDVDLLIKGMMVLQKASRESKMTKQHQSYTTNLYLSKKIEDHEFERIKIEHDQSSISGSEEMRGSCKNIAAVLKLRYKYLFHPHQNCAFSIFFLLLIIKFFKTKTLIWRNSQFSIIQSL